MRFCKYRMLLCGVGMLLLTLSTGVYATDTTESTTATEPEKKKGTVTQSQSPPTSHPKVSTKITSTQVSSVTSQVVIAPNVAFDPFLSPLVDINPTSLKTESEIPSLPELNQDTKDNEYIAASSVSDDVVDTAPVSTPTLPFDQALVSPRNVGNDDILTMTEDILNPDGVLAPSSPSVLSVSDEFMIIGSPSLAVTLLAQGAEQEQLSDHVIAVSNHHAGSVRVLSHRDGYYFSHNILIYQQINTPYIGIQLVRKENIEQGKRVTVKVKSNVPHADLKQVQMRVNNVVLSPDAQGYYHYETYVKRDELSVTAQLLHYHQLHSDTVLYHNIVPDQACNAIKRDEYLYASCFSDTHTTRILGFQLFDRAVGKFNRVLIGNSIPEGLTMDVQFGKRIKRFMFDSQTPDLSVITVSEIPRT